MKIAFDAQLLFEKQKTGIGWTVEHLLKHMIVEDDNEYSLNYFSLHHRKEKNQIISKYKNMGYQANACGWLHNVVYRRIWDKLPIPYSLIFGKQNQITQFFNYDVPPGVSGKAVTFIYDMVYKAFPETISKETYNMLDHNLSRACDKADHIITISEFSKKEIIKYMHIPESKISVMPCGVDHCVFRSNYSVEEVLKAKRKYGIQQDYILYLGTLEPRKNIETLIEAYAKLINESNNCPKLVIAGKKGWLYDRIFEKVHNLQLQDHIIFTGYVDTEDVPLLLKGAMIFVFPSIYEGFGLPPLEAMACGTPVITSNTASLPEVVGDAGILVNPYSVDEICDAMKKAINDEELRNKIREIGILHSKNFSWKVSATKLAKIYSNLL
ncbi:glycosyltransferase family 4 protein [Lachnospiraceae bacterium MD1]|uniref:Glycosyltransferase family 4 protein n=1 Tax=Variimorphobacter saccharofermentans TaxID=2755051 RepID=A0A839K075_9FIRM|nr:glycosyltransferase family 1 protein [Variimorphobacter saccharofermentans]MBB2182838.1 glycosyltransferase family 4 protein [Variimorphobacter saccharofermentans]